MATSPYSETIIDALITQLDDIRTQQGDNYTIQSVKRFDRLSTDEGSRPSIRVIRLSESKDFVANEWRTTLVVGIRALLDLDEYSGVATDKQVSLLTHDIEKAIASVDRITLGYSPGGINVTVLSGEPGEPIDGADMEVRFDYTVGYSDPENLKGPGV